MSTVHSELVLQLELELELALELAGRRPPTVDGYVRPEAATCWFWM